MRLYYARLRRELLHVIADSLCADRLTVLERDSGLHFLLQIRTNVPDTVLLQRLRDRGISLLPLSAWYRSPQDAPDHTFILNYSSLSPADLAHALNVLSELI